MKYWNIVNSWGTIVSTIVPCFLCRGPTPPPLLIVRGLWRRSRKQWGDKGYFKILRGVDECEIEEDGERQQ